MVIDQIKAKELFLQALDRQQPAERDRFLCEACGDDLALRKQVDVLLAADARAGSFLEQGAVATIDQPSERIGTLIGRYKLLEQVGEGGMGIVFVAEQTEPVRRRVALKIIKPGMDTKQVIARFEAERQALAMMDHPNIARVLDAGTTEASRPYFVMELVRGMPITEYCDKTRLSPRQRLELFVDVCQAVQHAHQKGIIHRDLKPSNVMVTMQDGRPVVKVIDFGVAKAVGQQLTERTVYTALTQLVGTPLYMSPEQAELTSHDVDTRSDVYSLGVLLYELLTGQTPFDKETLSKAGFDEMRRMIREDEPPRPSRRFSTLGVAAISTASQHRGVDERRLSKILCGELDWIVMKSLEKDRSRRYESASALATDIHRYLSDEPVLACPPTTMYRFQKFARKHKSLLTTAAAIAACLVLGTTVSAWQAARATQAEAQANANATQAQANAKTAAEKAQEATTQRDEAQKQRDEVKALADKLAAKEEQLQRTLYTAHINLAFNAWDAGGIRRVNELLEQHRPRPDETDLRGFEWHYLYRLCHPELLTLNARIGGWPADRAVAFSPDGKRLAFGHTARHEKTNAIVAGEVKVCDAHTGQELLTCKGHTGRVLSVAFSPDGKRLASAGGEDLKVWDAQTGKELFDLNRTGLVMMTAAFSPDGKHLASGSSAWRHEQGKWNQVPSEVKVWDAATGQELTTFKGNAGDVYCVAFSPDGQRLASGSSQDGKVKVWNVQTPDEPLTINAHTTGHVGSVAFSPDGKRLVSAGVPGVKAWDAQTGKELISFKELTGQINSVAFSPDGKRIASHYGYTVKVLNADTGEEILSFTGHTSGITTTVFSPDGTRLASASNDGTVRVWDLFTHNSPPTFSGSAGRVRGVGFSPDAKRVAGTSWDPMTREGTVKMWDAQTGQELLSIKEQAGESFLRVAVSPDGKRLAAGIGTRDGSKNNYVKVWDAQTGRELLIFKGHTKPVVSVAFNPEGTRVVSCSGQPNGIGNSDPGEPGEVKVWNAETGGEILTLKGHKRFVNDVAYSADGKRLATLSRDGTVKVWDSQTGQELLSLPVQATAYGSVAFSPDGKRIASSNKAPGTVTPAVAGEIKLWDAQNGEELFTLQGHMGWVTSLAFSPDSKRLASGTGGAIGAGQGREVKIWDVQTGQELLTFEKIGGGGVAFSPDGHRLVSAGAEGLKIFDATPLRVKP